MALELLLFFGIFGLVIVIVVLTRLAEKKRAQALEAAAAVLGLAFSRGGDPSLLAYVGHVAAMPHGNSRRTRNVVAGSYRGLDVRLFEYIYETGSGKNRQTHRVAVAWAQLAADFPTLTIVPENLGHKIFDALGGDDIDFESDEFSRKFWVKSADRKFAYDIIHGRMMEFLMSPGWNRWEMRGGLIVNWVQTRRFLPQDIQPILDRLAAFNELIPSFRRPGAVAPTVAPPTFRSA